MKNNELLLNVQKWTKLIYSNRSQDKSYLCRVSDWRVYKGGFWYTGSVCVLIWGLSPMFVPVVKIHQDIYTLYIFVNCALYLLCFSRIIKNLLERKSNM